MSTEVELIVCPNCHKKIKELIAVSDLSKKTVEKYFACPHCFAKLDEVSPQLQTHKKEKEASKVKPREKRERFPLRCAGYFGYLASRPVDAPLPKECLNCPKVMDCIMKTNTYQE